MEREKEQQLYLQPYGICQGAISIYLVLMIAVIIPLILTMIEAGRVNVMKLQLECAVDMGMDSVLAEYNRPLLEQYDLIFIDLAYGNTVGSLEYLKEHFSDYVSYNLQPQKELMITDCRDFLGLQMDSVDVLKASRATDEQGAVFRYMAVSYMLNQYGLDYIEDIQDMITYSEQQGFLESDIMSENDAAQSAIDRIEVPPPEDLEEGGEWQEPEKDDPTDGLNAFRQQGILSIVCEGEISTASIHPENYVTGRSLVTGNGMEESWPERNQLAESLLFQEYIMEKCGNYREVNGNGRLNYETEYVIAGQNNDTDNLRIVAEKLLLIRGGANSLYFFTNREMMAEAKALASSLSFVLMFPEFELLFEAAIIAGWIYAESVVDVRHLLSGESVPLVKGAEDWNLSLENALGLTEDIVSSSSEGEASGTDEENERFGYKDYLRILLYTVPMAEKTGRCMDIVEMNIRQVPGYETFCLDQCVASVTLQMSFSSSYGYSFLMKRNCHYT